MIGDEAVQRKVFILPLRADACKVPRFLRDKKFADFSTNYDKALQQLLAAIKGHLTRESGTSIPRPPIEQRRNLTEIDTATKFGGQPIGCAPTIRCDSLTLCR
jgi:hypothetical protein